MYQSFLALLCAAALLLPGASDSAEDSRPDTATVQPLLKAKKTTKVGQIFVVGNRATYQQNILDQLPFSPGYSISAEEFRRAEANLVRLRIFVVDHQKGIRPTVEVLDPDGEHEYKDILVSVKEKQGNYEIAMAVDALMDALSWLSGLK